MTEKIKRYGVLIAALLCFGAIVGILTILTMRQNQGHLIYSLDDPYIHMAIAKNFTQHGVFGVTKDHFSSSSSSILWILLLSLFYFFTGVNDVSPFLINLILGVIFLFLVHHILRRHQIRALFSLIILLAMVFIFPMPSLVFTGMEHILHALFTVLVIYLGAQILAKGEEKCGQGFSMKDIGLFLSSALVVLARYEGLYLVFVICCLFMLRKRILYSLSLGLVSILPISVYGIISVFYGWYPLPNSIVLKGNVPDLNTLFGIISFLSSSYRYVFCNVHILMLVIGALVMFHFQYGKQKKIWDTPLLMLIIFIASTFIHAQFASKTIFGQFLRYEAYLIASGIIVIGISLARQVPERLLIEIKNKPPYLWIEAVIFLSLFISPLIYRGGQALFITGTATKNIYEQQYQMGLFLKEFYQGEMVAANDIGAINYLADIKTLDIWGVGSLEVAKAKRDSVYTTETIYNLSKEQGVKIAIAYEHWFDEYGGLPTQWIKVGEWKIPDNIVCWANVVVFYAMDHLEVEKLIRNLKAFSSRLPNDVIEGGKYKLASLPAPSL